ncbi:hypothetical protein AVEN_18556-1, partial [Araneus ventricosus]
MITSRNKRVSLDNKENRSFETEENLSNKQKPRNKKSPAELPTGYDHVGNGDKKCGTGL